jgi:uncharacterized membrane protein
MALMVARGVVLLAGVSLGVFVCVGMVSPAGALRVVEQTMAASWGIVLAAGIRLALGLAMLVSAPVSPYPQAFTVVGWIAVVAAIVGVMLGRRRLQRFTQWWIDRFRPLTTRVWLGIAFVFAAFLINGVI